MDERLRRAELSIQKEYRKTIWTKFIGGLRDYAMLEDGDRVAVCISGGKDSMLLAKCMQLLQRFSPTRFELVNLVMDPGYSPENRARIEENAALLGLSVTVVENRLFEAAAAAEKSPCYLRMLIKAAAPHPRAQRAGVLFAPLVEYDAGDLRLLDRIGHRQPLAQRAHAA